jgi:hypothetical protein
VLLPNSPISSKILPSQQNRLPSNIPLRTLSSRHDHDRHTAQSTSLLADHRDHQPSHGRPSSDSADSDIDSWTDTGDIAEQLAAEDPLRLHLADTSLNDELGLVDKKLSRHNKRVQFTRSVSEHSRSRAHLQTGVIDKEAIEIPDVGHRRPSRGARLLAAIMPGTGIHGLTGKPLMYVQSSLSFVPYFSGLLLLLLLLLLWLLLQLLLLLLLPAAAAAICCHRPVC